MQDVMGLKTNQQSNSN